MKQIAFVLLWAACGFFNCGSSAGLAYGQQGNDSKLPNGWQVLGPAPEVTTVAAIPVTLGSTTAPACQMHVDGVCTPPPIIATDGPILTTTDLSDVPPVGEISDPQPAPLFSGSLAGPLVESGCHVAYHAPTDPGPYYWRYSNGKCLPDYQLGWLELPEYGSPATKGKPKQEARADSGIKSIHRLDGASAYALGYQRAQLERTCRDRIARGSITEFCAKMQPEPTYEDALRGSAAGKP